MSFGLSFKNGNDEVILDSEYSRLVILQKGRYSGATVTFEKPITSLEPPLIFARPDSSSLFQWVKLTGGPGDYRGWSMRTGGTGSYFVADFQSTPTADFGLRLWNGDSKLIFDNGTPCAQFTRTVTSWTHLSSTNTSPGRWYMIWTGNSPINNGDYMMLNNIAMDLCGRDTFSKLICAWDYERNRITIGLQNIGDYREDSLFIPVVFAKQI